MTHDRIAERRRRLREQQRRRRLRRTVLVTALVLVVGGPVLADRSGATDLERVEVVGIVRTATDDVLAAAEVGPGTPAMRIRTGAVAARVSALPTVASAEVRRVGLRQLAIEVDERVPVLQVVGPQGDVLVDRDGVIVDRGVDDALPVVELQRRPPEPGTHVADDPALANAHRVWRGLSGPLRAEVTHYFAAGPDDLTLRLRRGIDVRFGRAERIEEKIRAIGAVLGDLEDADVDYIDVRAPGRPVVAGT
jgi:cell division protein FtsQ